MDKVTIYRVLWSTLKLDATNRHGLADVITLEDHRRALDAERERLKGQIDYSIQLQQLIESLRRDDTPSPELYHHKIIVEFKRQLATLQAQLRQLEGQSKQQAEEAVIVFAKYTTLRQLVEAFRSSEEWGAVKAWMVEGAPTRQEGVEAAKRITKAQYEMENALVVCRQALAAQDAGKEDASHD